MASLRISIADDEPDMQEYFRRALARLGHRVVSVANNGHELIRQCRENLPDLVITDIKMDGIDGIDAAGEIVRERPIPVILVSAFHDPELVARVRPECIQGYLVKPIKQADLGPAVQLAMERFKQDRVLQRKAKDLRDALIDGLEE